MPFFSEVVKQYSEEITDFRQVWNNAEGFTGIFASPYFLFSLFITTLSFSVWTIPGWWSYVFSILPNLIGFSVGSYTLLWSISNVKLKRAIADAVTPDGRNTYLALHAMFLRFIGMQIFALVLALLSLAANGEMPFFFARFLYIIDINASTYGILVTELLWFVSFLFFIYALSLSVACSFAVYRISRLERISISQEIELEKAEMSKHNEAK